MPLSFIKSFINFNLINNNLYSTIIINGSIRERPDIDVKPWLLTLKEASKMFFLPKEEIERLVVRNLSFNGKHKSLWMNRTKVIEQLRDTDINHTKKKLSIIKSTLIIPQSMFDDDFTE